VALALTAEADLNVKAAEPDLLKRVLKESRRAEGRRPELRCAETQVQGLQQLSPTGLSRLDHSPLSSISCALFEPSCSCCALTVRQGVRSRRAKASSRLNACAYPFVAGAHEAPSSLIRRGRAQLDRHHTRSGWWRRSSVRMRRTPGCAMVWCMRARAFGGSCVPNGDAGWRIVSGGWCVRFQMIARGRIF